MKLNTRRTLLIGLAFFSICAFWQMYDTIIPLILRDTFHIGDSVSGAIMAADNVLALFLLPLFGKLSDRTNTRLGKRMPFILFGTACAVTLTLLLSGADAPGRFGLFIVLLGLLLIAMGTYRSPAVALMPDVTPKPLRSKANAIINLTGALGAIYALMAVRLLVGTHADGRADYTGVFISVAALMAVSVALLLWRVETLPELTANVVPEAEQEKLEQEQKQKPSKMETLLKKHCENKRLYLQNDLTLAQLAGAIGTNRTYLSQHFAQQGITYNAYINGLRIRHFVRLYEKALADGREFTAQQLAFESGFHSYSTFSNTFKQIMGTTVATWMHSAEK